MKKTEFKSRLFELFSAPVEGFSYEERMDLIEKYFIDYQIKNDAQHDRTNYGKSWTDDELRIILSHSPSKRNCIKFSRIFKRGYGSIEQIYRWASTDDKTVQEKKSTNKYIAQVKKIAKEQGWRGT